MKYSNRHISDEELDQLFRDAHASEGQESLFVPEFWSEVEAMLPAEKKAKRGLYWIPVAATAVLVVFLLFYPSSPAQIDTLKQKNAVAKNEADQHQSIREKHVVITENSGVENSEESVETSNQTKSKTPIHRTQRRFVTGYPDQQSESPVIHPSDLSHESENKNTEESASLAPVPESVKDVGNELDSIHLEPRNEKIIHEEIAELPKKTPEELNQWYVEVGPAIGQSPYLSPDKKRNVVGGAVLGGGYTKRIDNAFVSFGLQARLEGFGGLNYQETNFSPNIVRTVTVKQLYSLEVPLKFGYTFRRSELAFAVVPGIQLFVHGKERITENQVVQRESSFTGKVEHSNSLTMEFGFQYYYNLSPKFSIGAKVNADILRPFHTDYYLGKSAGFPVNGQIVLRRTFFK